MNLEKIAKYQIWANDKIRSIISNLTEEEFLKNDIQDLCIHTILAIEYNLDTKIQKTEVNVEEMYEKLYSLSIEEIMKKWIQTDERLLEYIRKMKDGKIEFPDFIKGKGKLLMSQEDFYFQYLSHTIYHRGQLMTAIKKLGKEGLTTDYLIYLFTLET
jgi:uncharacterized damage-inducible protein DinB